MIKKFLLRKLEALRKDGVCHNCGAKMIDSSENDIPESLMIICVECGTVYKSDDK